MVSLYYYHLIRFHIINNYHLSNQRRLRRSSNDLLNVRRILRFYVHKKNICKG